MSEIFWCEVCNISFNAKRYLISYEKTKRHREKAGESFQGFTCILCGRQFSRDYDIPRHQQNHECLGVQGIELQPIDTSNKRKHHADSSAIPKQRMRTTSPTRRYTLSDDASRFDTSDRDTILLWIPEQARAEIV
jgi:hypothetical protein